MSQHMLTTIREAEPAQKGKYTKAEWPKVTTALQKALKSGWDITVEKAVKDLKSSSNPSPYRSKRGRGLYQRRETAPERKRRAP